MSYIIYIRRAAELDIAQAQKWYEEQQSGLAAEFHSEFSKVFARLEDAPLIYPIMYRNIRRAVLRRFPFLVWFQVQGSVVTVLACTHGKADPGNVAGRLG